MYTAEQQARLGVDAEGTKVARVQALPPAWVRGEIEAPDGEKDMGGYIIGVYTAEQQARLGVDAEVDFANEVFVTPHAPHAQII